MPRYVKGNELPPALQRAAFAAYVHRFTMEHVPDWARRRPCDSGGTETRYYAPQYRSDAEWLANTQFPVTARGRLSERPSDCRSAGQTWPLGQWLEQPYRKGN